MRNACLPSHRVSRKAGLKRPLRGRGGAASAPAAHRREPSPTAMIEAQLSPAHEPVLGLYLHVAYHCFMASFGIVGRERLRLRALLEKLVYG